jgi:hypothetical protein
MQYQLANEKGRIFILPSRPPAAITVPPFAEGHEPSTSVDPMSEIDRYPELAR